jgi:predicted Zn-dependent protease
MLQRKIFLTGLLLIFFSLHLKADEKLFNILKKELDRSMQILGKEEIPPYFISYNVTDNQSTQIKASLGLLRVSNQDDSRILDIDLRVGDYKFDNTHIIRGNPLNFSFGGGTINLPTENDETALRNLIWFATDRKYKGATERLQKAQTNQAVKVAEEDSSADLSHEKSIQYSGDVKNFDVQKKLWEEKVKKLSLKFSQYPWIYDGDVIFQSEVKTKYFLSTEGSKLKWYETNFRIYVTASTKADDGMTLPLYESYFSFSPEGLPTVEKIEQDIDIMIDLLGKLRKAPMAETYSGPAILSGEAAGVFFHEIFGHRVEGHREKDPNSSQTFKNSVGKSIMPDFIDIVFDPTLKTLNNKELSGFFEFDDEGIKSEKVVTVDHGIFKNFLMSRSPIEGFSTSNGHGRRQAGYPAVSRQSNLIVSTSKKVSKDELIKMLKSEITKQNKDYGFYFEQVSGGFTFTSRTIPNAFNVTPLVVYKVFPDERQNELVRGVDFIGTPLTTFKNIIDADDEIGIFNGICGAESGGVPVSASSPSLLISTIEVQKKQKSQAKLPILPSPITIDKN